MKFYHGITALQHHIDPTQMASLKERSGRVKEGTSAILPQSGPDERWWSDSVECYCYLRNVQDLLADGKTTHERQCEEPIKGPIVPFEAMFEYHPISPKDEARIHQFGKRVPSPRK